MGDVTKATGQYATSMGSLTPATGYISTAIGRETIAPSFAEDVVGAYNELYTPNETIAFDGNDRIFTVANGLDSATRSNALTILKNGNTGIGTTNPNQAKLVVNGSQKHRCREFWLF